MSGANGALPEIVEQHLETERMRIWQAKNVVEMTRIALEQREESGALGEPFYEGALEVVEALLNDIANRLEPAVLRKTEATSKPEETQS